LYRSVSAKQVGFPIFDPTVKNRESYSIQIALVSKLRRAEARMEKPKGARGTPAPYTNLGVNKGDHTAQRYAPYHFS